MKRKKPTSEVVNTRSADQNHAVITVITKGRGQRNYRKEPCEECPWRTDQVGKFPAEAFKLSASTSYDAATTTFGCHLSKHNAPLTCAGFLLSEGADHNLLVRIGRATGQLRSNTVQSNALLFSNYRRMAIANGVDPNDPTLEPCRDQENDEKRWGRGRR